MYLLVYIAVLVVTIGHAKGQACKLAASSLQDKTPIFFKYGEFLEVTNGNLEWNDGENVYITCEESEFKRYALKSQYIVCKKGKFYTLSGTKPLRVQDLECVLKFRGGVEKGQPCGPSLEGNWYKFGFLGNQGFRVYFGTCYDMTKYSAIYSEHVVDGDLLNQVIPVERSTAFKKGLIPKDIDIYTAYTQASSEAQLKSILGPSQQGKIHKISYLARGHLAPNKDAALPYFMRSTFYYENAVPQWQSINVGNWIRIENAIRKKASQLGRKLQIFTGVHEVLKLPDDNNVERKIYLAKVNNQNILEVPMWMWKVVKDPIANEAIAFVTYNNPLRAPTPTEMLCTDVCSKYSWDQLEFTDPNNSRQGYTYCCEVNDLIQKVDNVPVIASANHVLKK